MPRNLERGGGKIKIEKKIFAMWKEDAIMIKESLFEAPEMKVIRLEGTQDVIRTSNTGTNEDHDVYEDDFFD